MEVLSYLPAACGDFLPGLGDFENVGALMEAGARCQEQANETSRVCDSAIGKTVQVVDFARQLKEALQELKQNKLSPASFQKMHKLLNGNKMKETLSVAREMEFMADDCVAKSRGMADTMMRGIPESELNQMRGDGGGGANGTRSFLSDDIEQAEEDMALVAAYEAEVAEIQQWTVEARELNLIKVATRGKQIFPGLVNKVEIVQVVFEKCKDLCTTVETLAQGVAVDGGVCTYIQASMGAIADTLKAIRLSTLLTKCAEIAHQLVEAIIGLLKAVWEKFQIFERDFPAAKKIQNWVNGLNPFKKNKSRGATDRAISPVDRAISPVDRAISPVDAGLAPFDEL